MLNLTLDTLYITKIRAHTASMLLIAKYPTMFQPTLVTSNKVRTWWKVVTNTFGSPSPSFIWAHSKFTNPLYTGIFTFFKIFNGELSPTVKSFKIQVRTSLGVAHSEYGVNRPKKSGVPPSQNCVGSSGNHCNYQYLNICMLVKAKCVWKLADFFQFLIICLYF